MRYQIENNIDIFRYLNPKDNDKLLSMSDRDLVNIMLNLKKYYLEIRKTLNIDSNITFAGEIEFEEAYRNIIELELFNCFPNEDWIVKDDNSLSNGGEINSPVLRDTEKTWNDLCNVCNIVDRNAYVLDNASAHIHIGMHILGNNPKYWRNFALLWMTYENIITRFLYGEYVSPRTFIEKYAKPISQFLIDNFDRIEDRTKYSIASYILSVLNSGDDRNKAVNFRNCNEAELYIYNKVGNKNTIEFRGPNGTFNPIIWQNNINLLVKLLEYCKNENFDEILIKKRLKQIIDSKIPSNISKYGQINIVEAIEFADLIFDNNLDKIYFLRQYIKDGVVSNRPLIKSKRFTI